MAAEKRIVYVIGAGLSAGLGFPTIKTLLPLMWDTIAKAGFAEDLAKVIRFHHPDFNASRPESYPNIEQLLSEIQANSQLFDSSRPATGNFTTEHLNDIQQKLLLEISKWFLELQRTALRRPPEWFSRLTSDMKSSGAQIVSFNWDLLLDKTLFGSELNKGSYGFDASHLGTRLLKPHGSLNWYEHKSGRFLSKDKVFNLVGEGSSQILSFKPFRAVKSDKRDYMPLIVPPIYTKTFDKELFSHIWREAVSVLSVATEVRFFGYSLPDADFHARFILRCGFHNQEFGSLQDDGTRGAPTGRARVVIVDPDPAGAGAERIERAVGWRCISNVMTVEEWVIQGGLSDS
jgi:hypothetical protein